MQLSLGNSKFLPGIIKLISHKGTHFTKVTEMMRMKRYFESSIPFQCSQSSRALISYVWVFLGVQSYSVVL